MIDTIEIQNFKSIEKIELPLGRINVFIGENGAGKSNLLEAIALAGAANSGKLDNEFLMSRGIRVTQAKSMRPLFEGFSDVSPIEIVLGVNEKSFNVEIQNDNQPYSSWKHKTTRTDQSEQEYINAKLFEFTSASKENLALFNASLRHFLSKAKAVSTGKNTEEAISSSNLVSDLLKKFQGEYACAPHEIDDFVIYSPENTALRLFEKEGQIEPLGINGEGLLKLLVVLSEMDNSSSMSLINESLRVLGWFKGLSIKKESSNAPPGMEIHDKYLDSKNTKLDQRSANEGFLFLLFYFALFSSNLTPRFFAIDNIDASLNPKLCSKLMAQLALLAASNNKQALLTTHNPAILDGLNLDDDSQRLFVVTRNSKGYTRVKRIMKGPGDSSKLSELFMSGVLGGLPKRF